MYASGKVSSESTSNELWLVRHAQTAWNVQRRFLGATDLGLDEEGVNQARALGESLTGRVGVVYASPLKRALETASHVCSGARVEEGLQEMDQGHLDGLTGAEALEKYPEFFQAWEADPTHALAPGGGSLGACRDRAVEALRRIAKRHEGADRPILVVSHQLVIASIRCWLLDEPLSNWRKHRVFHCEGFRIGLEEPWCLRGSARF